MFLDVLRAPVPVIFGYVLFVDIQAADATKLDTLPTILSLLGTTLLWNWTRIECGTMSETSILGRHRPCYSPVSSYVHRLIHNKEDGKLVELPGPSDPHSDPDTVINL